MFAAIEPFITSTALVAIGELGDKTQLLTLALMLRYRAPWTILSAVFLATLVNHGISAWLGGWLSQLIPAQWLPWILGGSFILLGLWLLIPDQDEALENKPRHGVFLTTLVLFFLAEIGDKTQLATVALAVTFNEALIQVVIGSTLGMLLANAPVVWIGSRFVAGSATRKWHLLGSALFIICGVLVMVGL